MIDRLSPVFALSAPERDAVRRTITADPDAIWPAIKAALAIEDGERTARLMLATIRGEATCTT